MSHSYIKSLFFRFETLLILVIFFMAGVILFYFGESHRVMQTGDAPLYIRLANNLLDYGVLSGSTAPPIEPNFYRLPGYPIFLASIFYLSDRAHVSVMIVQFILFALTAVMIYRFMRTYIDKWTAIVAASLFAVHLPLIFFASLLQTEIVSSFLAVSAMILLMRWKSSGGSVMRFLLIGILCGILALIRPSFSALLILTGIGLVFENHFYRSKEQFTRAVLASAFLFLGFSIIFAPWLVRNYELSNRIIVSPSGAESFYWSVRQYKGLTNYNLFGQWETQYLPGVAKREAIAAQEIELKRQAGELSIPPSIARELFVEQLWRDDTKEELKDLSAGQVISKIPGRILALWQPSYIHAPNWIYVKGFQRIPQIEVWLMLGGAMIGFWSRRRSLLKEWPLWIVPLYLTVVHMIVHLETRYSIPGHPFVLMYAAIGIVSVLNRIKPLERFGFERSPGRA